MATPGEGVSKLRGTLLGVPMIIGVPSKGLYRGLYYIGVYRGMGFPKVRQKKLGVPFWGSLKSGVQYFGACIGVFLFGKMPHIGFLQKGQMPFVNGLAEGSGFVSAA